MASLTVEMCVGMQFADIDEWLLNGHDVPEEVLKAMGMLNGQTILDKLPADHKFSLDMLS